MRIVFSILAAFAFASAVGATVIVPAEFREIVTGSQAIIVGRVSDVRAEWADERRRIDTYVTVDVASQLKGAPESVVTFLVPGGQIGRYRSILVGAPVFAPGDEVVLFLSARAGVRSVFGLNQGVFRIRVDSATGRRVVIPPALLARSESAQTVRRGAATRLPVAVEQFSAQVRAILAEAAGTAEAR